MHFGAAMRGSGTVTDPTSTVQMGKCNRDIKLENIMVVDKGLPLIKLCNFGLAKDKAADSSPATQAGSALFTAPEVLLNVQVRSRFWPGSQQLLAS